MTTYNVTLVILRGSEKTSPRKETILGNKFSKEQAENINKGIVASLELMGFKESRTTEFLPFFSVKHLYNLERGENAIIKTYED